MFYFFLTCYFYVILQAAAQENPELELNQTANINSSIVDTLTDFFDKFLQDYEKNRTGRKVNVCTPSPCHQTEKCVRIGENGYRCVCPPGLELSLEDPSRYHFNFESSLYVTMLRKCL